MQVCTSLQTDNHASTPALKFFTGRTPFLPPNQQRESTEGTRVQTKLRRKTNPGSPENSHCGTELTLTSPEVSHWLEGTEAV